MGNVESEPAERSPRPCADNLDCGQCFGARSEIGTLVTEAPGEDISASAGDVSARQRMTSGPHAESCDCTLDFRTFLRESAGNVLDAYERLGDLGEGGFGEVWLARQRIKADTNEEHAGRLVAVKRIRKPNSSVGLDPVDADSDEAINDLHTEVELMKSLDHPSICRLLRVHEDRKNIYLVMEHIKGSELFERVMAVDRFGEKDAAAVVRQAASALAYCHKIGVVHRDVKPENIIVEEEEDDGESEEEEMMIKLIDFGFGSRILQGAKLKAKVGTFLYTAPETLKGDDCDEKIDVWALGCVLYVLLSGNSPFWGNVKSSIIAGKFSFEGTIWSKVSQPAKDLISSLLIVDPKTRMTAASMHDHPWLHHDHDVTSFRHTLTDAIVQMKSFHDQSVFRHLCSAVLARQTDESTLHGLHAAFMEMDVNEDGVLSPAEFKNAWTKLGIEVPGDGLFEDIDMDGNGQIDYTEFVAACLDQRTKHQEELCWAAFRVFDVDGNGTVSFKELRKVVSDASLRKGFTESTLEDVWQEFSGREFKDGHVDVEGEIDFDHFLAAVTNATDGKAPQQTSNPVARPMSQGGYPIAKRTRDAATKAIGVAASSLPIVSRRRTDLAPNSGGAIGSVGLPIARRQVPSSRNPESETAAGQRNPSTAGRGGSCALPIVSRGVSLPIASRRTS